MSRAYRITVSESVNRHIRVADGIRTQLELLNVLGAEAMCELLSTELARRGFERRGDQMVRSDDDGVEITIGVAGETAGHVTVRVIQERDIEIQAERSKLIEEEVAARERERMQQQLQKDLIRRERAIEQKLSAEVTKTLERKLRDLRKELNGISHRVTAEALKLRAGQLGEIREITEDPESGTLTIKVHV